MYPKCSYRYTSQIGYTLCDYGNDNLEAHKKKIRSCCANACPLGLYPESEKMSLRELYERDMKEINIWRIGWISDITTWIVWTG